MQTVLVCGRMMAAAAAADTAVIPDPSQQNSPTNKDVHTSQVVLFVSPQPVIGDETREALCLRVVPV